MAASRTFSIIKPDATRRNLTGAINSKIEEADLRIVAQRRIHMTREQAKAFYAIHAERPFYNELVEFMTSSETHIMKLEKADAVSEWRNLMGATNPAEAEAGTIRAKYGTDISMNATHGSDSNENAEIEINFFF